MDYDAFKMLDTLRPIATGLNKLPAWFLRLAAPVLCGPVADLINTLLLTSTVPSQWKQAHIRPVPKTSTAQQAANYWPISITPVLYRVIERIVIRRYIYPTLSSPHPCYSSLISSLSGLRVLLLLPSLLCATQTPIYCHLNPTRHITRFFQSM